MSSRMKQRYQERHWAIPGLVRVRRPATDLYPYLPTERAIAPRAKQQSRRLLSDAKRQHVSPLGGQAVGEGKGKR
jgi:hypothetical protein